ncbi:MAG: hypothetical protein LBH25_01750 [Fibromonadaceae bacterium]|nr:hypothetical protein [Fibromonadaceae bacterium]
MASKTKKATRRDGTNTPAKKKATAKAQVGSIKILSAKPSTKRPPNNPDVPHQVILHLNDLLNELRDVLNDYSQHLRSLDRMRLNGVGVKKLGFVERAYELALENAEFLPHYLTIERFGEDIQYFIDFRSLLDIAKQIEEKLWNIVIQSADIAYTDGLEFYASVREAAKRRVDAAETIYAALSPFFKRHRSETEEPTMAKAKRDFNSLIHGKHDGKLVIENIMPKLSGGKRKIIDETFKDKAEFKDREEGVLDV